MPKLLFPFCTLAGSGRRHLSADNLSIMAMSVRTTAALILLPSVSVVLVIAVLCLGRVAARRLSALARAQYPSGGGGGGSSSSFRRGYLSGVEKGDHVIMRELPVALYKRRSGGGEEEEECVFCLSGIEEGSEMRELKCRHIFHRGCLDRWMLARPLATCPLCRCRLLQLTTAPPLPPPAAAPWSEEYEEAEGGSDSDLMLFMACVHSRSSWLWPS